MANLALYHALKAAGVSDELADKAAESVGTPVELRAIRDTTEMLTRETQAIRQELHALDVRLTRLETRVDEGFNRVTEGFNHLNRVVYGVILGILLLLARGFWPA